MKALKTSVSLILSFLIVISVFFVVPFSVYGAENNYALSYNVGPYVFITNTDGTATANFDGKTLYYSDDFDDNSIGSKLPKLDNQNVVYELHNSRITNVYTIPEVITPKVTVSHSVKDGIVYRNGKFSHNSFDLNVSVKPELSEKYQKDDLLWFLSNDEKNRLYATLTKLEIQPSGGVDFGSSGWWLWKDYQTNISESFNDQIKVNESKDYKYTVNLQNDKAVSQSEYNIEIYTTPTFDFGSGTRLTSKIRVGNLDYQGDRAEEKKLNSVSGKAVTQASSTLNGMSNAMQFSKNYLSSAQTKQVKHFVNLWLSELILAKYAHKSELKEQVSDEVVKLFFKKLGVDTGILTLPGTIQATTYLQTKAQDGTSIFIEFTIKMMDFDFGDSGMPTMATGSGTATIYNMDGEKLDSSVILPAYADVCAFCTQLQKVAKSTILNGIDSYRTIFGINKEALAEALSSQIMAKILNNSNKKDYFNIISSDTVRNALKKAIEASDSALTDKIFELAVTSSQKSTRVSVKCPVDVVVYDNDGKICGEVRNNVVDTSYNDVFISVVGDQKNIYLVGDDYSFKLVGTDKGTMDYDITEFDESGEELRTISYKNLALSSGCKYSSYVPEALNHSSKLFDIIDKDGNIISPTSGGDKETDDYDNDENVTKSGQCGKNVYYKLFNDGTLKIYGSGEMYNYNHFVELGNIKRAIIENGVTSIGEDAFKKCEYLTSVNISDSVTSICYCAFCGCTSLTNINIPDSVTNIGSYAFSSCKKLTSIRISDNITSISDYTFGACTSLKSVNIPYNVKRIGNDTFGYCESLTSIEIPDSVTEIGSLAFEHCTSLTRVKIGNSVKSIGGFGAFRYCTSLTSVNIPDSVTSIGEDAFEGCTSLTRVNINDIAAWCKISFNSRTWYSSNPLYYAHNLYLNGELVTDIIIPDSVTSISEQAFCGCESLTSINIPDSVTSIGHCVFSYCKNLKNVTLGNNVTSIGRAMFKHCENLESVIIGNNVKSIGEEAFRKCENLTSINIPDSVTSIGGCAFLDCTNLKSVTIGNSVKSIGEEAFFTCTSLTSINIPDSVTSIGDHAFYNCTSLESIIIPDSVTSIGVCAFSDCTNLKSVTIGNSVTSIGSCAFYNCTGIKSVNIPNSVKSICDSAFYGCESLTSINIPDSVISIGKNAFYGCKSLTSINVPNSITSIDDRTFRNCSSLTNVKIGNNVTSIGEEVFDNTQLTDVYYSGTKEKWSKIEIGSDNLILLNATVHFGKDSTISQKTIKTNTLSVTAKTKTIKLKNLKKKAQKVKPITIKNAKGKVTYKLVKSGINKKIRKLVSINSKGVITINKWKKAKKGTYKIKVSITAAGNSTYQSKTITKTIKIKVK